MTTSIRNAVSLIEKVSGFSATVKQLGYIALTAERKAKASVYEAVCSVNRAENDYIFACNNHDTDLSWAVGGTVEGFKAALDDAMNRRNKAEMFQARVKSAAKVALSA